MSELLPVNATDLERQLAEATRLDLPVPLRQLWNPHTCPANLLPWLAWQLHVDSWHDDWPESVRREVIANAVEVHRKKGTLGSVRRLLGSVGAHAEIREWPAHQGAPHTFEIDIFAERLQYDADTPLLGPAMTPRMQALINDAKPARSSYTLSVGARYLAPLATGGALQRPGLLTLLEGGQPLEHGAQADPALALGGALGRPATFNTVSATQHPHRALAGTAQWHYLAALERPALLVTPAGQQALSLRSATHTSPALAGSLNRPTLLCSVQFVQKRNSP
ncbi:phage tail protein I [Pseudomonas sp. TCU-HL1]|uniref:phage tail protein I n=1 Tax=Pseudomonas sp. TCU-HL1 TaxID=1856685 RepID=UPI00083D5005|nr:phage tail protein I [Pseudomonas sp. TCU-HL1]AOE85831.1 hypothetical protein THL1_3283 [Pseudomonas sp. TCU-HL1]